MFLNRQDAGKKLAQKLLTYKSKKNTLLLGIPRGGVVVAAEVSKELNLPLDVIIIKKLGFPGQEELALGAVGEEGEFINPEVAIDVDREYIKQVIAEKKKEVFFRVELLRGKNKPLSVRGKTVLLIDDGIATGATVLMALEILKKRGAKKIVVAVPVAPKEIIILLKKKADEVVCLEIPEYFGAIGRFYHEFEQASDKECKEILGKCKKSETT
ncbi:phosphoribosyltransferase [Candidatus Woesearchaeota archaeon]|nr:phosphoribosyltransferase [Candidatus Woesearchaeota archaeon]